LAQETSLPKAAALILLGALAAAVVLVVVSGRGALYLTPATGASRRPGQLGLTAPKFNAARNDRR
jgi:hypothetical protein